MKKDFDKYYKEVEDQYKEMLDIIKELEEGLMDNTSSPETLDRFKESIEPVKNNYMTLTYVMYLLNRPNKKVDRYNNQNKKLIKNSKNKYIVKQENEECLKNLKNQVANIKA